MSAVQNDTLKINHCVNRAAPVSIYRDWPASLCSTVYTDTCFINEVQGHSTEHIKSKQKTNKQAKNKNKTKKNKTKQNKTKQTNKQMKEKKISVIEVKIKHQENACFRSPKSFKLKEILIRAYQIYMHALLPTNFDRY